MANEPLRFDKSAFNQGVRDALNFTFLRGFWGNGRGATGVKTAMDKTSAPETPDMTPGPVDDPLRDAEERMADIKGALASVNFGTWDLRARP